MCGIKVWPIAQTIFVLCHSICKFIVSYVGKVFSLWPCWRFLLVFPNCLPAITITFQKQLKTRLSTFCWRDLCHKNELLCPTYLRTKTTDDHSSDSCISPNGTAWTPSVLATALCTVCTGSTNPAWSRLCRVHTDRRRRAAACWVGSSAPPGWRNWGIPGGSLERPDTPPTGGVVAILVRTCTVMVELVQWCTVEANFGSWCCFIVTVRITYWKKEMVSSQE